MDAISGNVSSFSFVKAYLYMQYIPEAEAILAIAMNTDYKTASLGVRLREMLANTTLTILGFKIVEKLENALNASEP